MTSPSFFCIFEEDTCSSLISLEYRAFRAFICCQAQMGPEGEALWGLTKRFTK